MGKKTVFFRSISIFKTLFTSLLASPTENEQVVDLKEYSKRSIEILLDYMYTGSADLKSLDLLELLRLVEFLQCNWIVKLLVKAIRVTINAETWLLWFNVGVECNVDDLITLSVSYAISTSATLI